MNHSRRSCNPPIAAGLSIVLATFAGCASTPPSARSKDALASVPEIRPGVPAGYLGHRVPDSLLLLPPPPPPGSAGFRQDQAVSRASQRLHGTSRYALAAADADLAFPHAPNAFACALGAPISQQDTPRLYLLLKRAMTDAGLATYGAKDEYSRTRPFVHYGEGTCAPADEAMLRNDGSYPSGHTSVGWAWALILAQLAPARADALLARGRSFGESRLVCNAHWSSDVIEGRAIASATVAKLHSEAAFNADMNAASREIEAVRRRSVAPGRDCASEAAALAIKIPGAL
ncbi:phosphatase PAP2 family protein [Luteimonas sp. SX5]|uniref:Acid phosphatase n=1 Tax=Luteimonas galliterrae TaxID=2940486 RepID=A0ABT0MGE9_9GAMM|nr:phosphatase PAP2 family protein [Luteimonas galliterrae]MCL1633951.1 phosphatase PAP2 family protein [Luteimonas galliterrae]